MIFDITLIEYQLRVGLYYYREQETVDETLAVMSSNKALCLPRRLEPREYDPGENLVYLSRLPNSGLKSRHDDTYTANEIFDKANQNEELLEKEFLALYNTPEVQLSHRFRALTSLLNLLAVRARWEAMHRTGSSEINFLEDMGTMHACCYIFTTEYTKRFTKTYELFIQFLQSMQQRGGSVTHRELFYTCYDPKKHQEELLLHKNPIARLAARRLSSPTLV